MGSVRRWVPFFIPGGVLFFAALGSARVDTFKPMMPQIAGIAPYLVFPLAALIGWRFNRSSLFFAAVILAGSGSAFSAWTRGAPCLGLQGEFLFHAFTLLVPLNLLIVSLIKERGIFTLHGMVRIILIAVQPALVSFFARLNPSDTLCVLKMSFIPLSLPSYLALSPGAFLAFLTALSVIGARFAMTFSAKEGGFFWALLTLFTAFPALKAGALIVPCFPAAGLILLASVIEASHAMAFKDEITGLPARRALKDDLLKLGSRYALAMVDIDRFKKFNDTHGHDVGDQVLRMTASKLARVTGGGKAFRYGGEEFTVIFPGRYAEEARHHLEELRKEIEGSEFVIRSRSRPGKKPATVRERKKPLKVVSVTVSIGWAFRDEKNLTPQAVLKAADKALYRAKEQGRNCVRP